MSFGLNLQSICLDPASEHLITGDTGYAIIDLDYLYDLYNLYDLDHDLSEACNLLNAVGRRSLKPTFPSRKNRFRLGERPAQEKAFQFRIRVTKPNPNLFILYIVQKQTRHTTVVVP